jgi:hypothetical protein
LTELIGRCLLDDVGGSFVGGREESVELAECDAVELVARVDACEGLEVDAVADFAEVGEVVAPLFVEAPERDFAGQASDDFG